MLHWKCVANGIKTHVGVIGFNKWSDDHFQNGWHWLNETELFFFFFIFFFYGTLHSSRAIMKCACEWKRESGRKEMWKCLRDIQRMNHFQVWEHLSPWARNAETGEDFSLYPSCFQSENIFQCRPECGRVMTCEKVSDRVTALSYRDGDRGRWGMSWGGEKGGMLPVIFKLCRSQVRFLRLICRNT